jgi:hypothetical protein
MYANISFCSKLFHILPIIPVYLIILTVGHAFTKFYYSDRNPFDWLKTTVCVGFYTSATLVVINHSLAMFVSPGFVNSDWQPTDAHLKKQYAATLFCKQCNNKRPERAHHCKVCKKCVLKMDHHCPWVANCVGFYNQKYFYLFLFYAVLGNLIAAVVLVLKIINMDFTIKNTDKKTIVNSISELFVLMWNPILLMTATIMSAAMVFAIGVLFIVQTRLILNNITTVETHIFVIPDSSPFSGGNKYHNFKTVMGDNPILWFLPVFSKNSYNNGYSYSVPGKEVSALTMTMPTREMTGSPPKYVQLGEMDENVSNRA